MSKSKIFAWTVWIIASVFYAYQYILRVMPNIMLDDIMRHFDIGAAAFGQFSGIYYIGYSLMHLPIGIMLDRFGPKKIMTGCILLSVVGLLPLIFADYWIYPIAGRLLIGMGSSGAILGLFKIIRMTFNEKLFPRMLSISVTIGLIGAIYGGGPVSYMCDMFGYRAVIEIFALLGVALAFGTFLIVPAHVKTENSGTVFSDIKEVLSNRNVILSCLFAGLMVGPLEGFADVWGTAFFKQVYGFDSTLAASLPSMIFIGMCFGAPVLNLIAEKAGYLVAIIGSGVIMATSFSFMLLNHLSSGTLSIGFVLVGIASAYQILAIYKASTYVRPQVAGLTTAIANMIIMIFGYAFHTAIGTMIHSMGGSMSAIALEYGIAIIPVGLFLGTAGFIFLFAQEKTPAKTTSLT